MISLICNGGILDRQIISKPNNVYEFTIENCDTLKIEKYIRYTKYDGFGNCYCEWILNNNK